MVKMRHDLETTANFLDQLTLATKAFLPLITENYEAFF